MGLIKGMTVELIELVETGKDPLGNPVYEEKSTLIDNVIVSPTSDDDKISELQLYGKTSVYTLCIPKGDEHDWRDVKVRFFNETWKSFGNSIIYDEKNVPLDWNRKVKVELNG